MKKILKDMLKNNKAGISITENREKNILVIEKWTNFKYCNTYEMVADTPKFEDIKDDIENYLDKEIEKIIKVLKEITYMEIEIEENSDIIKWSI